MNDDSHSGRDEERRGVSMDNDVYFKDDKRISFLMIPWALITESMFHGLSMESKVLYAMMLDRMGLSKKNNWLDEQKRVFIYYTVDEIIEKMGCCKQKAVKLLKELMLLQ